MSEAIKKMNLKANAIAAAKLAGKAVGGVAVIALGVAAALIVHDKVEQRY